MNEEKLLKLLKDYPDNRKILERNFEEFSRYRQIRVLFFRIAWWIFSLLSILILFLLTERTPIQSEVIRYLAAAVFYGACAFWIIQIVKTIISPPDHIKLAMEIEEAIPGFKSSLVSAAEFVAANQFQKGTSPALTKMTISEAARQVSGENLRPVLARFSPRKAAYGICSLVLILTIWHFISPFEVRRGFSRLTLPFVNLTAFSPLSFDVKPGNSIVAKGENLQISAAPSYEIEGDPVLVLFKPGAPEGTPTEMYPDETASRSKFVFTLTSLQESTDYQVTYDKFKSERFAVTVLPRPEIKSLRLTLNHPEYLGIPPQELDNGIGECSVLRGTKIKISVQATQKLSSATILFSPPCNSTQTIHNDTAKTEISPATSTRYSISLTNEFGLTNENPVRYLISVTEDSSPTVDILKPAVDLPFPKSKRLDLKVAAKDDFGLVSVILYYSIGNRKDWIPLNMKSDFSLKREFEVEYPWMLDTLAVEPGVEINYNVRAEDCFKPVPHVASTPIFRVTMPSMYDVYRGTDSSHEEVSKQLKDYLENQKLQRDSLSKAFEEIKHEGKLNYEAEKQLEKAIQEGEERQKNAQEILEQFDNFKQQMENNPFSNPESLERLQKISELLNQVLDDEAKKLMKQLQESLKDMKIDPKEIEKYEQAFKMDDYIKNLDRTVELLEQMREQMKMNALGEALQDLKKRQEKIASETAGLEKQAEKEKMTPEDESKLNDLRKQQEKVKDEMDQLKKQTDELASKKPQEGQQEDPMIQDMKNLRDKFKQEDFKKSMEEIDKKMQDKQLSEAQKGQQKMLKFLESLAKDGQKMCKNASGGQQTQMDLSRFIRKALSVSQDQEKIMKQIDGMPDQFMRGQMPNIEGRIDEVSILELMVKRQGQDLENALETFVRSSFSINPDLLTPLAGVQGIFSTIVKDLEDRALGKAQSNQREIIRRFNRLAIELMKTQDQGESGQASPMDALQQFKKLTQRQLSLYQQTQKQQMSPADKGLMEQLKRMAMEQRKVRESLEKLMREGKGQKQILGRMEDVINEMEDLETKILDPKLRREVSERQKAIYDRMLKAQKSLRNREEEKEERKAEKAREIIQPTTEKPLPSLGTDSRDLSRDFLSDLKEDYPKSYETEINDYFKSLNLYGNQEN